MGWEDAPIVTPATPVKQAWENAPIVTPAAPPKVANGLVDDLQAGYQGSATGLAARGKLPDIVLDPHHAQWYDKLVAGVGQMGSELPEMVVGSIVGAAAVGLKTHNPIAAAVGGGAGAFALPTAIRQSYINAIQNGEIDSSADFFSRARIAISHLNDKSTLKATATDAAIGGLTGGTGKYAELGVGAMTAGKVASGTLSQGVAKTLTSAADIGTQATTLTVAPALLEGRAPEVSDFTNAAIMMVGLKGSGLVAKRLGDIYAKTGIRPEEVLSDAKTDPTLIQSLVKEPDAVKPIESNAKGEPVQTELFPSELPKQYQEVANRQAAIDAIPIEKAKSIVDTPFADIPEAKLPTQINLDYVDSPDAIKATLTRMSQVYSAEIENQRGGTQGWAETEKKKTEMLKDMLGTDVQKLVTGREPGTAANAVELSVRGDMLMQSMMDMSNKLDAYEKAKAQGLDTPQMKMDVLEATHKAGMIQSEFIGASAEAGRALQYLQKIKEFRNYADSVKELTDMYGGNPDALIEGMINLKNDPTKLARASKKFAEATTYEKFIEAWKSGLVSGPVTHMANIMGNTTFAAIRPLVDAVAATTGALRMTPDRVTYTEVLARVVGNVHGMMDGLRDAMTIIKSGVAVDTKADTHRKAISGVKGEIIRLPFRFLSAEDAVFRIANERGEAYSIGTRVAMEEGYNPLTREFRDKVAEVVNNPTDVQQKQINDAGTRMTFNSKVGKGGQAIQSLVDHYKLHLLVPFIQTPMNVLKEMSRLTPFAPLVPEWRADIKAGGAKADKAIAELAIGTSIMGVVATHALSGNISGNGNPDPAQRRVDMAAGWQPYSIKVGDTWYNYQRLAPIGTLIGLAADMAEAQKYMTLEENDKVAKILGTAFAQAVTNQTFLQGVTNITNAMSDPTRFMPVLAQQMAGSMVPGAVSQVAQWTDPYVREVNSISDAVKNRIPGARTDLFMARDPFGEPIAGKERVGGVTPISTRSMSEDKVRTEASRLHVSVAKAPKNLQLPALGNHDLGKVELSPAQQDMFASTEGKLAYDQLSKVVNSKFWDEKPDLVKKMYYDKIFANARHYASMTVLTPEERKTEMTRITDSIYRQLDNQ